ncbi:formate dehydrogenase subunit delta [Psychromarinibacter sp. C21-152]|uniref:Formate dehydrogenase subunit delta n=1 Tax=Psychromarinibacter sediminicola TaxID=3033385 RepID=A0AAE3TBH2_9RHOB|nr:formate dehydrogenase subunit delta [Psychromarinibacter sediminicola]MDF0602695.1 formate dehydrogenase subunit delta [Psychromarinibacter sediminicola]
MSPEKLVRMANQIATFFATQPGDDRADRVAAHINEFWEPRMRAQLAEHMAQGGEGLHPLVTDAFAHVKVPAD